MKLIKRAGILVCLILLLFAQRGPAPVEPAAAQGDPATLVFNLVNQVRADHGLAPFRFNGKLAAAAQMQADFNAANTLYGHDGAGGSRPQGRANSVGFTGIVVENVVGGWDLTPQQAVTWWINSPVHYNTLITTRYAEAGTGFSVNGRQNHYTLVVGRPSGSVPANTSQSDQPAETQAIVVPITLSTPGEDGSIVHTVRTGQTFWAIAARYGVKLETLLLYNNLAEDDFIRPGQKLIVQLAEGQTPPPTPTPPLNHTVRAGETAWTIAARYRIALADLFWYNNLNEDSIIRPGDSIIVRLAAGQSPPPTPTPRTTHLVQPGESLWGIAALYGLTLDQLVGFNGLAAGAVIQPGDELSVFPPTAVPTPTSPANSLADTSQSFAGTPMPTLTPLASAPSIASATPTATLQPGAAHPEAASVLPNAGANAPEQPFPAALVAGVGFTVMAGIVLLAMRRD